MKLSVEQLDSFRRDVDQLRAQCFAEVGERDAQHIRNVRTVARISRIAGRLLIQFSLDPVSWTAGVLALSSYKCLENMEIGHNVLHGQYNFMKDPEFSSRDYEWELVATAKSWKRAHNATHHAYTNVIGRDGDFGYKAFRFSDEVPWKPVHLLQPLLSPLSGVFFQYSIGAYDLELDNFLPQRLKPVVAGVRRPLREVVSDLRAFLRKAGRKSFVEYVLFPALAGPLAAKVAAGNAVANLVRNVWAYAVIHCGHLTEDAATFREEELVDESKGHWYLRQVAGTSNFELGWLGHVLSGHLGYQIEHHLFPNLPAWRYPEIAPRVRAICERHGVPYHSGPFASRFSSAMRRLVRFSVPHAAMTSVAEAQVLAAAA